MIKQCKFCHKDYKTSHIKTSFYCSKRCMARDYKKRLVGKNNPNFKNAQEKRCKQCNKIFYAFGKTRKFCSHKCYSISIRKHPKIKKKIKIKKVFYCKECKIKILYGRLYCKKCSTWRKSQETRKCKKCNKEFKAYISSPKKLCSRNCYLKDGNNNPNWKGGKRIFKDGYVSICIGNGKRKLEHDMIMEKYLGRKLKKNEIVHHINNIKDDNRIENLHLMDGVKHLKLHNNYKKLV